MTTPNEGSDILEEATLESLIPGMKPLKEVRIPYYEDSGNYYIDSFIDTLAEGISYPCLFDDEKMAGFDAETRNDFLRYGRVEKVLKMFRDQVVIDLGSGPGVGYYFAALAKAKGYIGVDKHYDDHPCQLDDPERINEYFKLRGRPLDFEVARIPGFIVGQDMLTFLRRLPDASVSLLASGIDGYLIPNDRYLADVRLEIARVLNPDGVYICHDSPALSYFRDIPGIEPLKVEGLYDGGLTRPFVRSR